MQMIAHVIEDGPGLFSPNHTPAPQAPLAEGQINDQDDITCPQEKVSQLIGAKGATINEVMRRTGCKIQVIQDGVPDGVDRKVSFTGTPAQVEAAKPIVLNIIEEGPSVLGIYMWYIYV